MSDWDDMVDELTEADKENPSLPQMVEDDEIVTEHIARDMNAEDELGSKKNFKSFIRPDS